MTEEPEDNFGDSKKQLQIKNEYFIILANNLGKPGESRRRKAIGPKNEVASCRNTEKSVLKQAGFF